jgi:predicted flap endonuclease-1-like 5' DNA nuclease
MFYPALSEKACSAAAEAARAWSEAALSWSALFTAPPAEGALERLAAVVRAGEHAQAASLKAAFLAASGARWAVSPFGVTGVFCSTAPVSTEEEAQEAAERPVEAAAAPAPALRRAFQALARPLGRADDLTRIKGVGPKMQEKLNALGVFHFWQLASLARTDAEKLDAELAANGRVVRDAWVAQAKKLAEDVTA